jgi:hypothetical protein
MEELQVCDNLFETRGSFEIEAQSLWDESVKEVLTHAINLD